VEPGGVEPPSKQATRAAFSMLSPRLFFDLRLTVDGPPETYSDKIHSGRWTHRLLDPFT
jgi:hypothetical protein